MSLIVTGTGGFIGSNFVLDWLEQSNESVVNLDLFTYAGNLDNLKDLEEDRRYRFVSGNIGDRSLVSNLLADTKPRAVISFAAESHVDRSIHSPGEFIQTNIVGTFNLLESVRGYWNDLPETEKGAFRFLHVSTDEVYGSLTKEDPPFSETDQYEPNSPYSASKAGSDHLVRAWHHTYGLPVVTTNCSNNYGLYHFPEKLIPLCILNALNGKPLPIYGDGQQVRDWLYVKDHCSAIRRVLESGKLGEAYNVGGWNEKLTSTSLTPSVPSLMNLSHGMMVRATPHRSLLFRIARSMIAVTPLMRVSLKRNWVGSLWKPSRLVSRRLFSGIWTMRTGLTTLPVASIATW